MNFEKPAAFMTSRRSGSSVGPTSTNGGGMMIFSFGDVVFFLSVLRVRRVSSTCASCWD
jgi:hypothetical protein